MTTTTRASVRLTTSCGLDLAPDANRWFTEPDDADLFAIDGLDEPVLDVGCGPGRIVAHLAAHGTPALGVDVSRAAIAHARDQGAPVLHRSVFDPIPGTGRWGAAVLLDGNIGIGGDPVQLLARLRELLRPGGLVVAEVGGPHAPTRVVDARIAAGGESTPWFPWAIVGNAGIGRFAAAAGLRLQSIRRRNDRHFATISRP